MTYRLFVPAQAVGANLVYFDFFNATGSGKRIHVISALPVIDGSVAVTGVVAVNLFLTRTTAVGTGGTLATYEGTSTTAATITQQNGSQPLNALVSARLTPTGGATAGAVLGFRSVFTEETSGGAYTPASDLVKLTNNAIDDLVIQMGSGIRVVQGAVASVGNIGFDVAFNVYDL